MNISLQADTWIFSKAANSKSNSSGNDIIQFNIIQMNQLFQKISKTEIILSMDIKIDEFRKYG